MKTKHTLLSLALAIGLAAAAQAQIIVFSEDFDNLANGTTITTSNTSLTYVRVGSQGGSITAQNPSSFGAGASGFITGPSAGSLNGIGVTDGLNLSTAEEIAFDLDFRLTSATGIVNMGIGSGTSFTGSAGLNISDGLFWLRLNGLTLQRRITSAWVDVTTVSLDANYSLSVLVNTATDTMDISLNNILLADDVAVTTPSVTPDAFRIYSVIGSNIELDNITISSIPEPTTYGLMVGGVMLGIVALRRRSRKDT